MGKIYFLTGATGFVGRYITKRLLEQDPANRIILLVRESGGVTGPDKVAQLFGAMFSETEYRDYFQRVQVLEGDVSQQYLGLDPDQYHRLGETVNVIFHAAASIKFNLPLEAATRINIEGTRSVLELAEQCHKNKVLERLNHISTAYVTGKQKKCNPVEQDLEFANTYELTKYRSEELVKQYIAKGLPVTIYRPSIIFGHSETGEITENNIIFQFVMMFSRNLLPSFPCHPESSLNMISINYFMDQMFAIAELSEAVGHTYNITHHENTNLRDLILFICNELGVKIPHLVPSDRPDHFSPRARLLLEPFVNYIEQSHCFDNWETRKLLQQEYRDDVDIKDCMRMVIRYGLKHHLIKRKNRSETGSNSVMVCEHLA